MAARGDGKAKRRRGDGSIVELERDKRYLIRVSSPTRRLKNGRAAQNNYRFEGTKTQAEAFRRQKIGEAARPGAYVPPSRESVGEYLTRWLNEVHEFTSDVTREDYHKAIYRYLLTDTTLPSIRMTDVRDTDIKAFYNRLKQRTNSRTGKPLTRWLGYTHQVLRCALREAGDAIPGKNPMQDVKAPKPLREPFDPDAAENQHALSQEQVGRFLDAVAGTRHATLFNLWFATGLRPGEIFGLRWRDVSKDSASITLSTAVEVTKAHGARLKTTLKTPKSHRTIPLPPAVSEMLRAHRTQQNVARLQVGGEWRDMDLVFANELGGILDGGNLTDRHFRPALERAGLSPAEAKCYSLYDIRHTHATLLLQTGESIVTVSRRLGHATVTLTLNTYAHCLEEHQQAATNRITGMFWAGAG